MAAGLALPGGPVPVEKAGDEARLHIVVCIGVETFGIARVVGASFRINLAHDQQILAIGRDDFTRCLG